jgi:hypothetical protein
MVRIVKSMGLIIAVAAVCLMCFSCGNGNVGNESDNYSKPTGRLTGHDYVDLGLPSGTLWATCNVGANSPEEYGDYFAWGETTTKRAWDNYRYEDDCSNKTKYTNSDGLTTLQSSDDAATANWGSGWRMPTYDELNELKNNCTVTWTTQNGINGRLFTGPNGNSIFLPAAGYYSSYDHIYDAGFEGNYWSGTLSTDNSECAWWSAWILVIKLYDSEGYFMYDCGGRTVGRSVRPVCDAKGGDFNDVRTNKQDEKIGQQEELANWLETDLLWRRYNIEGYDLVLYSYWFKSGQYMLSRAVISSDYYEDFEDWDQHGPYKYSIKGNTVYNGDGNVFFEIDMSRNYIVIGGKKYYRGDDAAMSAFKKDL